MVDLVTDTLKGFKDFILRGNVIDLAVAVALGAAFTAVVNALAVDFFGSLIAAFGGVPDLSAVGFELNGTVVQVGPFLAAVLNFLIVAAVLYFFVVVPVTHLFERRDSGEEEVAAPAEDVALLREIRDLLRAQAGGPDAATPDAAAPATATPATPAASPQHPHEGARRVPLRRL
jgi:large conductance mechanosensitive channel